MLRKRYSELMKLFVKHNNFKSEDEFIDLFCAFIYGEFSAFTDGEVVYIDEDDELEEDENENNYDDDEVFVEYNEYEDELDDEDDAREKFVKLNDEIISREMNINSRELQYLKNILMEQIGIIYASNQKRNKIIGGILDFELERVPYAAFFEADDDEFREEIAYFIRQVIDNKDDYRYTTKEKECFYDIIEKTIHAFNDDENEVEDEDEFDMYADFAMQDAYQTIIEIIKTYYPSIDEMEKYINKTLLMAYANEKLSDDSGRVLHLPDILENDIMFDIKTAGYNDTLLLILEYFDYVFKYNGVDYRAYIDVTTQEAMDVYNNIDTDIYNEVKELSQKNIFLADVSNTIDNKMIEYTFRAFDEEARHQFENGVLDEYNRKVLNDSIHNMYIRMIKLNLFCDSSDMYLNKHKAELFGILAIRKSIVKYIEYWNSNYKYIDDNNNAIFNEIISSNKYDNQYLYDIFSKYGENFIRCYLEMLLNPQLINLYQRKICKSNLTDVVINIDNTSTNDYSVILSCKNMDSVMLLLKAYNIFSSFDKDEISSYRELIKNCKMINLKNMMRCVVAFVYENLICAEEKDENTIAFIENIDVDDFSHCLKNNPQLFRTIRDYFIKYMDEDMGCEKEFERRKDEKIKAKINVISKLNPYYKNEIESFK